MIAIIDYGLGNLGSILNMLRRIEVPAIITSEKEVIKSAKKLILPGVGSFDAGMKKIEEFDLLNSLYNSVFKDKKPILGICLGFQLFAKRSEEGELPGLGWLDCEVVRFNFKKVSEKLKVPHMCWNEIALKKESRLMENMHDNPRYYFVHSYHQVISNKNDILATTHYGYEFVSAVENNNIYGVQFHPEKSHKYGMKLLENFSKI